MNEMNRKRGSREETHTTEQICLQITGERGHEHTECYAKTEINIIGILMADMDT